MPLVPFADIDALPPKARETWDGLAAKLNIFRMMANADTMMGPALRFGGAILSKQQLGADLRELVILLAAELEGGEYEWNQHVSIGLACGCTQAQIDAVKARRYDDPAFDAREQALMVFSAQVIEKVRADEDVTRRAMEHFSPKEIVEIILTCGFYMTMARLTETTRTDIDPPAGSVVVDFAEAMSALGPIRQTAYIVADIEAEMARWVEQLGVGPWFYVERAQMADYTHRGVRADPHVSIALANSGPHQIELIQQRCATPTMYAEFTDAGRFGLHHVAFWTDAFDARMAELENAGYETVQSGNIGADGRFAYLVHPAAPEAVIEVSETGGRKGRFFDRIRQIAESWDGSDPIRRV